MGGVSRDFPREELEKLMGSAEAAAAPDTAGEDTKQQPLNPWQAQHAALICVSVKVAPPSSARI